MHGHNTLAPALNSAPSIIFFGTSSPVSLLVFERMVAAGIIPIAVIIADSTAGAPIISQRHAPVLRSPIPLAQPYVQYSLMESAWGHGVRVLTIGPSWGSEALETIRGLHADLACVACFPWRIPRKLREMLPHGFLNLHPSLLPAHRGPAPVFWTLWNGETQTGATIHVMDAGLDSGPIVMQHAIDLPEGISQRAAEDLLATLSADLLIEAVQGGAAFSSARREQAEGGSYEPWPSADSYQISQHWPARRAFICMRGLAELAGSFQISLANATVEIHEALSYDPAGVLGAPFMHAGDIWIQMSPGVLRVRGVLLTAPEERIA